MPAPPRAAVARTRHSRFLEWAANPDSHVEYVSAQLTTLSIGRPARELLLPSGRAEPEPSPWSGRVLAVFEQACSLIGTDGEVVALVTPSVRNGPLNVVVRGEAGALAAVQPEAPARMEGTVLQIGGLKVELEGAAVWEPCPDWRALRQQRAGIGGRLPRLREMALRLAPAESVLALPAGWGEKPRSATDSTLVSISSRAQAGARSLQAGWEGDQGQLERAAELLAGLGGGLTPAGDDFLMGAMLWAWLVHPEPRCFGRVLSQTAGPRTTLLSAAWLRAAAEGLCSAPWHRLLTALSEGGELELAVREVLAHGATSGADALAGFLLMACRPTVGRTPRGLAAA